MKIEVPREAFAETMKEFLQFKATEVNPRDPTPMIERAPVKIEFNGNVMTMKAIGDALVVQKAIEVKIIEDEDDFMVVVDAVSLSSILKTKSLGKVISCEFPIGTNTLIINNKAKYSLDLIDARWFAGIEFPSLTEGCPKVLAADFKRLISTVSFAMGTSERRELRGVHIHTDGDELVAVATNGEKLARYAINRPDHLDLEQGLTIPKSSIDTIIKFLSDAGDLFPVHIEATENRFSVWTDHGMVSTILVEKQFPDYRRLLSGEPDFVSVDYQELFQMIEICQPTAGGFMAVRKIDGEEGLALESWNDRGCGARTFISGEAPLPNAVVFNPKYMAECLTVEVGIDFGDGIRPIRIKGELDTEFEAVINPMKVAIRDLGDMRLSDEKEEAL